MNPPLTNSFRIFLLDSNKHLDNKLTTTTTFATIMKDENRALTALEMEEIAEYERIVEFANQVFAGTHPRVRSQLIPQVQINFSLISFTTSLL
jgi:hypothetical protein